MIEFVFVDDEDIKITFFRAEGKETVDVNPCLIVLKKLGHDKEIQTGDWSPHAVLTSLFNYVGQTVNTKEEYEHYVGVTKRLVHEHGHLDLLTALKTMRDGGGCL